MITCCWRCSCKHVTHIGFPTVEARMAERLHQCHLPLCLDCSKAVLLAAWGVLALEPTGRYSSNGKDPTTIPPPVDEVPIAGYLTLSPPGGSEPFLKEYLEAMEAWEGSSSQLQDTGVFTSLEEHAPTVQSQA